MPSSCWKTLGFASFLDLALANDQTHTILGKTSIKIVLFSLRLFS